MAHLITSDDKYPDFSHDDAYRTYLITRTDSRGEDRFGRTQENAFASKREVR
jgi:hypothetical protein